MTENQVTQLVAVTEQMRPWTAGMGGTRTYQDTVPLADAESFLLDYDVKSDVHVWVRPAEAWDDPARTFEMDGQSYTAVNDPSRQVIYRATTDTLHGVPTDGYTPSQPSSLIQRAQNILQTGDGLTVLGVTMLDRDGAEFALTVGTREVITVDGVGSFVPCLALGTSLNGRISNYFTGCSLVVVCYNTQAHALGEGQANGTLRKVRHTKNANERLDVAEQEVRDALGVIEFQTLETIATMETLARTAFSAEQFGIWVADELFPIPADASKALTTRQENNRSAVSALAKGETLGEFGNAWNALQAANTFDLWERGTRGDTNPFARATRELVTGASATREADRFASLQRVLARV